MEMYTDLDSKLGAILLLAGVFRERIAKCLSTFPKGGARRPKGLTIPLGL